MKQEIPKFSLKVATEDDFDDIKRLCINFYNASIYNDKDIEDSKVNELIDEFVRNPGERVAILAYVEGKPPCGIVAGAVATLLFNRTTIASEIVWWVDPEQRRSRVGLQLLEAFEYWAENIAKTDYVQMVTLADDKSDHLDTYYKKLGYVPVEKAYLKKWQQ